MEKVKEFFVKLGQNIRANKVSLGETVVNGGVWGILGYLVNSVEEVAIEVAGFNITPLFVILGFALVEIGFQWESFGTFIARISPKLAKRLEKRKAKEAEKSAKEAEKERQKLLAEMKAEKAAAEKAEKEKAEAIEKARAEAAEKARKEQEDKELAEWLAKKQAE